MSVFLLFSTLWMSIIGIAFGIVRDEGLVTRFVEILPIPVATFILCIWLVNYIKKWRKSAKMYWKKQAFLSAFSLVFFSTFPIVVVLYLPFKKRMHLKLSND